MHLGQRNAEFSALVHLEIFPYRYHRKNFVTTLEALFLMFFFFFILAGNKDNHDFLDVLDPSISCESYQFHL